MNILFISNLFPPHFLGGYEILCSQVRSLLEARGHKVQVLTSDHRNPGNAPENDNKVCRRLGLFCPFDRQAGHSRMTRLFTGIRNYLTTRKAIKHARPDVIFIWSQLRLTTGAARAAQASGIPCVYTFNDDHIAGYLPVPLRPSLRAFTGWLLDRTIFRYNCLYGLDLGVSTSISERIKRQICEHGVDISNSKVIYQGIPLENFPRRADFPGIPSETPKLLYAGQLHDYKGVHTLLEAANMLPEDEFTTIHLTVVGDGPEAYKARLRQLAGAGRARVTFSGRLPVAAMPEVYRKHDVFVFPSIWPEPFGLTHLEAMASGTPVVSTSDGGHGEFLEHGKNALVFAKNDPASLAAALRRLLKDGVLARQIADNARKMVEERFTLNRYVSDIEKLLLTAVERGTAS